MHAFLSMIMLKIEKVHIYTFTLIFPALLLIVLQIWVPSNPRGAERLPPGVIEAESDFYLRRLWGKPSEVCILPQLRSAMRLQCF